MSNAGSLETVTRGREKIAVTVLLDPESFRALEAVAEAESLSTSEMALSAVIRDLEARQEVARGVSMFVAAEALGLAPGPLVRTEGESDERFAQRSALMDQLFAMPDAE